MYLGSVSYCCRHLLQLEAKAAQLVTGVLKLDGLDLGQSTVLRAVDLSSGTVDAFVRDQIHDAVDQFQPLDPALNRQAGTGKGPRGRERGLRRP